MIFGEQLGCKFFVEDIYAELERHYRAGKLEELPAVLTKRFPQEDNSIDGILCWDVFDFLDKASTQALARQIIRMVRPGGAVMGLFCTAANTDHLPFTKYEIVDDNNFRHRLHPGVGGVRRAVQNRDIIRMFEGLVVSDSGGQTAWLLSSTRRSRSPAARPVKLCTDGSAGCWRIRSGRRSAIIHWRSLR